MKKSRYAKLLKRMCFTAAALLLWSGDLCPAQQRPKKIGLALSGGGARGAAHIGVLKILEREKIPVDCIAGTSFGALVGGLYAIGYSAAEIEQIFLRQDWSTLFSDAPERRLSPLIQRRNFRYQGQLAFRGISPELPTGLSEGQRIFEALNELTAHRMIAAQHDFDRLPIPFRAVSTDLITGKAYIFDHGRITEAMRASIAIPMIFTPIEKDSMLLVDGGLSDNYPTDIVRQMGADIVIGVDVTEPLLNKNEIRTFLNVMDQTLSLLMKQSVITNQQFADLNLHPDLDGLKFNSYTQMAEIILRGEKSAENKLQDLKTLAAGIPPRVQTFAAGAAAPPIIIESVNFVGLKKVTESQMQSEIRIKPGEPMNPNALRNDLSRLYATGLFDHVDSNLEPLGENRYRLSYILKESSLRTLGASIRYDKDYKFVALAELTERQLFGTPSSVTLSSQFGGLQNHSLALRYVPAQAPFLYLEPKVHLRRRERKDYREGHSVDKYTDERIGGQLMIGGTIPKRIEIEVGYRDDLVSIAGGTSPRDQEGSLRLAGITFRASRDTLDAQGFPRTGMIMHIQADKRSEALGGDLNYTKYYADVERYLSITERGTFNLRANVGFSRGPMPFFDQFYIGGFNFSEGGPIQLMGFNRDEILARQMAVLAGSYRHQLFSRPLSFAKRGFLSVHYNIAAISDRMVQPYEARAINCGGICLGLDTMLGPMRIAWGWGEGSRNRFYLSLGPGF
jgi:NTE family protein